MRKPMPLMELTHKCCWSKQRPTYQFSERSLREPLFFILFKLQIHPIGHASQLLIRQLMQKPHFFPAPVRRDSARIGWATF